MKKNLLFRTFAFLLPLLLLNSIYANRGNAFTTGNSQMIFLMQDGEKGYLWLLSRLYQFGR